MMHFRMRNLDLEKKIIDSIADFLFNTKISAGELSQSLKEKLS